MHQSQARLSSLVVLIACLLFATVASADVTNPSGGDIADGTHTGKVTSVSYEGETISEVTIEINNVTYTVDGTDATNYGKALEKAFDNGNTVTIVTEDGHIEKLTRSLSVKPGEQEPQQIPR